MFGGVKNVLTKAHANSASPLGGISEAGFEGNEGS